MLYPKLTPVFASGHECGIHMTGTIFCNCGTNLIFPRQNVRGSYHLVYMHNVHSSRFLSFDLECPCDTSLIQSSKTKTAVNFQSLMK